MKFIFAVIILFTYGMQHVCVSKKSIVEQQMIDKGFVNISKNNNYIIDLKYATNDNFTKKILYDSLKTAYLHPLAAEKLEKANEILMEKYPNFRFIIFDAARPLSIQKSMYETVKNTPFHDYVANPQKTGLHNYGMAVDLSIIDMDTSLQLDMGTPFDFFGKKAGPAYEDELLRSGQLTKEQVNNRRLLREVMTKGGFLHIRGEWWHFNAMPLLQAKTYGIIE